MININESVSYNDKKARWRDVGALGCVKPVHASGALPFEAVSAGPCTGLEDLILIRNVGTLDRVIRIIVGLVLLGSPLAWYAPENISAWGYLGLIPLITGLLGTCPIYSLFGWKTTRG